MNSKIILRRKVELSSLQVKMIASGWGEKILSDSTTEKITYLSDGLKVNGYVAYPNDNSKKYPCVIWCRGGLGNSGAIDEFNARGIFGQIASWGYVVFASQYRGNADSEGKDEFGGGDLNDVLNLIPLADEIDRADKNSWGIEGWSRGGMMVYLLLTKTNIFKAAVTIGALSHIDFDNPDSDFINRLIELNRIELNRESVAEMCYNRSIINFPEKLSNDTKLLIIHGTSDDRVSVNQSIELSGELKKLNYFHRLELIENGDHFLKAHRSKVNELRKQWFDKYLKQI
jgi:dipeptidyl aminopeptidase/acylaminoacyl peptidase